MPEHLGMARLVPHPQSVLIGQSPDSIWTKDNLNLGPKLPWACVREINSRWAQEMGTRGCVYCYYSEILQAKYL